MSPIRTKTDASAGGLFVADPSLLYRKNIVESVQCAQEVLDAEIDIAGHDEMVQTIAHGTPIIADIDIAHQKTLRGRPLRRCRISSKDMVDKWRHPVLAECDEQTRCFSAYRPHQFKTHRESRNHILLGWNGPSTSDGKADLTSSVRRSVAPVNETCCLALSHIDTGVHME